MLQWHTYGNYNHRQDLEKRMVVGCDIMCHMDPRHSRAPHIYAASTWDPHTSTSNFTKMPTGAPRPLGQEIHQCLVPTALCPTQVHANPSSNGSRGSVPRLEQ